MLIQEELLVVRIIKVGIEPDNLASFPCFKSVGFMEVGIDNEGLISLSLKL